MSTTAWILLAIVVAFLVWRYYPRTFRGFEATTKRANELIGSASKLNNFDNFKKVSGGDAVEYNIMKDLKRSGRLNSTALTAALLPYDAFYRSTG